jgi:hypothetical protein
VIGRILPGLAKRRAEQQAAAEAETPEPSYSQEGEDRILLAWLSEIEAGFYVDVGAHHPKRFSNTALLYDRGWHGLNVDPMPGTKVLFNRARPRDITVEVAVGGGAGQTEYYLFDDPALNSSSRVGADRLVATTA